MTKNETLAIIVDAARELAAESDEAFRGGYCSAAISRCDIEETLLALADKIAAKMTKRKPAKRIRG